MTDVQVLPLLFSYKGPIFGRGFLATVDLRGRIIARVDPGRTWLEGVNPGAFAASGRTLDDANVELRQVLTNVFIDFAAEAEGDPQLFQARVEEFFHETDPETIAEWATCVTGVRSGHVKAPDDLPRAAAETPRGVEVTYKLLNEVGPVDTERISYNTDQALAAAA